MKWAGTNVASVANVVKCASTLQCSQSQEDVLMLRGMK